KSVRGAIRATCAQKLKFALLAFESTRALWEASHCSPDRLPSPAQTRRSPPWSALQAAHSRLPAQRSRPLPAATCACAAMAAWTGRRNAYASSAGPACCNATTCMLPQLPAPADAPARRRLLLRLPTEAGRLDLSGLDKQLRLAGAVPVQRHWTRPVLTTPNWPTGSRVGASASAGPLECYEGIKLGPCATLMCVGGQGKPVTSAEGPVAEQHRVEVPVQVDGHCAADGSFLSERHRLLVRPPPNWPAAWPPLGCLSARQQTHLVCSGRVSAPPAAACLCLAGLAGRSCERPSRAPNDRVNLLQQLYWSPAQGSADSNPTDKGNGDWTIVSYLICALIGFFLLLLLVTFVYICRKKLCRTGHQNFFQIRHAGAVAAAASAAAQRHRAAASAGIGAAGSGKGRQKNDLGYESEAGSSGGSLNSGCQINRLNSAARLQQQQSDTCSQTLPDNGHSKNKEVGELQEMSNLLDSHLGRQSGSASSMEYDECETRLAKLVPPAALLCDSSMQTDKTPKHSAAAWARSSIDQYLPESDRYKKPASNGSGASYSNANVYSLAFYATSQRWQRQLLAAAALA
uniref:EGF-like domain-containing protein n=1 Tax=Macrostomum lignano TaxID=282301 RepID=A0A1I8JPD3_9PLAT